ncbi:MAG: hypothetical protein HZB43_00570 [candidate division Zixibacteria bacterium]|nr:hypothetical protein [candidate division Zixibacteria bacterium]
MARKREVSQGTMLSEINQTHDVRRPLLEKLESTLNRNILTFFTSTRRGTAIQNPDNDMIEGMAQSMPKGKGLTLVLSSLGGDPLEAERIVNTCRAYAEEDFEVIVPRLAKSAATMVCFGAQRIHMSKTSELGPIDPQIPVARRDGTYQLRGAYYLIKAYEELFERATKSQDPRIEPYLQQLERFDEGDIVAWKEVVRLSGDIAVKLLLSGMLKDKGDDESAVMKRIEPFTNPEQKKTHGRPIYVQEVKNCGLVVEEIGLETDLWALVWNLYLRSDWIVNSPANTVTKLCESVRDSYYSN